MAGAADVGGSLFGGHEEKRERSEFLISRLLTFMWLPQFSCPECREALVQDTAGAFLCVSCQQRYERRDGIYRFLTRSRSDQAAPFLRQYRAVREQDGYHETAPEYYRMLPVVAQSNPRAGEWRVRRESYAHFQQRALPGVWQGPIRALDLGAGSGWLSHRLASFGHHAVAVDRLDDDIDGLGACRHYPVAFAVVVADFDALPFEPAQFDVVILNSSLHYSADPTATLSEAKRMLVSGGSLVVMDSPMFSHTRDGHAMVDAQRQAFTAHYGVSDVIRSGVGFLTFGDLDRLAGALGLRGRFFPSRGPLGWRVRRHLSRLRLRRAPAACGVWVAQ
jgi:SAM-dependent methyltransferase